jgi:glucokinase
VKEKFIISVDLGGTKILSALLSQKNEIVDRVKMATDITKGPHFIVECILDSIKEILTKNSMIETDIKAICLGVPGTVDPQSGFIGNAPNLGIKNFNIKEALQNNFKVPVLIENDVNLAALGIKRFEFNNKVNNMLIVFIGTGIGAALVFNGKMYRGSSFYAGEIGHMKVSSNGELDSSAGESTFENLASRTAIVRSILNDIKKGKNTKLIKAGKSKIKSKVLAKAVFDGDKIATKHVDKACNVIGTVLGSVTTLLNIDTIVLGGGVIEAMDEYMMPKIINIFEHSVLPEAGKNVVIVPTKLGDDAPLYGGVELAAEFLN